MTETRANGPAKIDIIAVAHTCQKEDIEKSMKALIDDGMRRGITVGATQYYPVAKPNELAVSLLWFFFQFYVVTLPNSLLRLILNRYLQGKFKHITYHHSTFLILRLKSTGEQ